MTFRFMMSTAASALLAATAIGATGMAAAQTQPAASDAVLVAPDPADTVNTDNGVRAAPSGQVSEARLPGSPQSMQLDLPSRRTHSISHHTPTQARLSVGLTQSEAASADQPGPQIADPSPGEAAQARAIVFQGRSGQLTALDTLPASFPAVAEPEASDEDAAEAPAVDSTRDAPEPQMAQASEPQEAQASDAGPDAPGPEEARAYGLAQPDAREPAEVADSGDAQDASARAATPEPQSMQQHVAFPRRSVEAAAAFDDYMQSAASIGAELKTGSDVAEALKMAAAYEPKQLEEGMIAYGAIAALQDARFVYGVMDAAADGRSRQMLIREILDDPHAAGRLPGADEASAIAAAAILREARPVISEGKALKQASYDVQHQAWSTAKAFDGAGRLSLAKAESASLFNAHDGDMARLLTRITALRDDDNRVSRAHGEASSRSIALAALAILDGAQTQADGGVERLLSEYNTTECLKMAKLNLFQCLSVAGPEYEDVFCLGKHAVLDTGQCIADAADPSANVQLSALRTRTYADAGR